MSVKNKQNTSLNLVVRAEFLTARLPLVILYCTALMAEG